MRSLRTLVSLLVLIVFVVSVSWSASAVSDTTKKMAGKAKVAAEKAKTEPATKHIKGYTTKTGKVVKGYERKAPTKVKEPTKVTKPSEKVAKPTTKATKPTTKVTKPTPKAKTKTVSKGAKGGAGPAPGMVYVKGYCKKNGVCVKGYWRHAPTKK